MFNAYGLPRASNFCLCSHVLSCRTFESLSDNASFRNLVLDGCNVVPKLKTVWLSIRQLWRILWLLDFMRPLTLGHEMVSRVVQNMSTEFDVSTPLRSWFISSDATYKWTATSWPGDLDLWPFDFSTDPLVTRNMDKPPFKGCSVF